MAADLDAVFTERDALMLMIRQLDKAENQEQQDQMLALIQAQTAKLEQTAQDFGAEQQALFAENEKARAAAGRSGGKVEVKLTPQQRQHVLEQTGVEMQSVIIPDPVGARTQLMPQTPPDEIERHALAAAEEFNRRVAAHAAAMAAIQEAIAAIEDADDPRLLELIEQLKADPNFLAGLLAARG